MMTILIWIKNIAILFLSLFFLIIGINTLLGSYKLKESHGIRHVFFFRFSFNFSLYCWNHLFFLHAYFLKNNKMELIMMKQNNIARFVFVLAAVFLISGHSYGFDLEKKVVKAKLKNGLTVLMLETSFKPDCFSLYPASCRRRG